MPPGASPTSATAYEAHFPYATLGFDIEIRGGSFEPKGFGAHPSVRFE